MVEGNKDRILPESFAKGVINGQPESAGYNTLSRLRDTEDPEVLTRAIVRLSNELGLDPPASTSKELFDRLPDLVEPEGEELTQEQINEALLLGAEDERKAAHTWGEYEIPTDKIIPPN